MGDVNSKFKMSNPWDECSRKPPHSSIMHLALTAIYVLVVFMYAAAWISVNSQASDSTNLTIGDNLIQGHLKQPGHRLRALCLANANSVQQMVVLLDFNIVFEDHCQ